jgi:hypothetical protein
MVMNGEDVELFTRYYFINYPVISENQFPKVFVI